ncbi:MAG: hypothetical protein D6696_00345 [Acidobacteria bacterium]|nr:MAG: hypothetical protein D6696_00345 [Acidobacteriota bacterium]
MGKRSIERLAVAAGLGIALLAGGCWRPRQPPPVVLITVDTLRADRLGCYGAEPTRTPNVDRLAAAGTVFEQAAAPLPETRPSHASILSSRYPRDHGVVSNAVDLPADVLTLAEVYRDAGYRTAAFVAVALLGASGGFDRGFDDFAAPEDPPVWDADRVVPQAVAWLRDRDPERPFFLWLHLFDPHIPYQPPAAFDVHSPAADRDRWPRVGWLTLIEAAAANGGDVPRALVERAKALYDAEIEHADHQLGTLLEALETTGLAAETVVALTADHGECFGNGIYFEHSSCLYDGSIHVPLILRFPGRVPAGERRRHQVELLDLAPTLLRLSGLEVPASFRGRDLFAHPPPAAPAFLQYPLYPAGEAAKRRQLLSLLPRVAGEPTRPIVAERELLGLRTPRWKYLWTEAGEALYHLPDDPGEHRDVAAVHPAEVERFRRAVRAWRRDHPLRLIAPETLSEELRRQLEALGYL